MTTTSRRGIADPKVLYPLLEKLDEDGGASLTYEQKVKLLKTPYAEKVDNRRPMMLRRTKRGTSVIQLQKGWNRKQNPESALN